MEFEIVLCDYNELWPTMFIEESERIRQVLFHQEICAIEHFGSTSIKGLAAKPIIDILVGFKQLPQAVNPNILLLQSLNYEYIEALSVPGGRLFFKKTPRSHHVHFVQFESEHWRKPLIFRDYLRQNPHERMQYQALKESLAIKYRNNREEYGKAKTGFVENILFKAALK